MNQHFLQSEAWEKFQHALGNVTIRRTGDGWSYLAIVERGGGLTRLYCPYGPTVVNNTSLDDALEDLKTEAEKIGAAFIRIQPQGVLVDTPIAKQLGLSAVEYSQPVATRVIDLSSSLDQILSGVSQSKRSVCRNYQRKGLTHRVTKDPGQIELLFGPLHDIAARNRITVHSDDYIRTQAMSLMPNAASLHSIQLGDTVIAAALLFEGPQTNYYAHAGTLRAHYKLQANTALIWELIQYSKGQGKHWLDLFGIAPDDNPAHPWAGVSAFKASFGGRVIHYNQTYDLPVKKTAYRGYMLLRSLKKHLKNR